MFLDVSPSVCLERFYNSRGLVVGEYPRHSKSLIFSFFWPEFSSNHLATKHSTWITDSEVCKGTTHPTANFKLWARSQDILFNLPTAATDTRPSGSLWGISTGVTGPSATALSVLHVLLRLDSATRPGITVYEFNKLLASCCCGLVMTHCVFTRHICSPLIDLTTIDSDDGQDSSPQVIDLTLDSDEDIAMLE